MFKAHRGYCRIRSRSTCHWLPHNHGSRTIGTADNTDGYRKATIFPFNITAVAGLVPLGAINNSELVTTQFRLDPENHLGQTVRILHCLIMHSAEISSLLLDFINMKNILLIGLGMGQDDTVSGVWSFEMSS